MNFESYEKIKQELIEKAFESYQNGDLNSASSYFEKLFVHDPYNKDTYFNLAKVYYERNEIDKCIKVLLGLLDLGDEDDSTFTLLGDAYMQSEKYSDALLSYKRVLDSNIVEEKIQSVKELFKQKEDKLYLQYMNYPYPNKWEKYGIPKAVFELQKYDGPTRRKAIDLTQFVDINYMQLKYWNKYKDLSKLRILNAGCGTGELLTETAFYFAEAEFVGIDMSEESIKIAKKHANKLKLNNVTFKQRDISKLSIEDMGEFDIIVSTGVLHHLYNPLEGIIKLKNLLKEDGLLVGMVYATIGRREVYDFREIFEKLFTDIEQMEYKLKTTKHIINSLQPWQRLDRIKHIADLKYGDQGVVDLLLNANETSYTTEEIKKLFFDADMNVDLFDNNYLNPLFRLYNITSDDIIKRIKLLNKNQKQRIAELLNGSIFKHHFISYRKDLKPVENILFSDNWYEGYPILWSIINIRKDEQGHYADLSYRAGTTDDVSLFRITGDVVKEEYAKYRLSESGAEFLKQCQGQLSVKEILNNMTNKLTIKDTKILLFTLWNIGILFLRQNKEIEYKG